MNLFIPLKTLNGEDFKDGATVQSVILAALLSQNPNEKGGDWKKKIQLFDLSKRVHETPSDINLTSEEITIIKDRVGAMWPPLIVGRVIEVIDPASCHQAQKAA